MNLHEAEKLAHRLMREHNLFQPLDGSRRWSFRWSNAKRQAGVCRFVEREIALSRPIAELWPEEQVRDTILHEIAHAIAGHKAGHGPVWRAHAVRIGAKPDRTYSGELPTPELTWTGICPACGHEYPRSRRPRGESSCSKHGGPRGFKPHLRIEWHRTEELRRAQRRADRLAGVIAQDAQAPVEPVVAPVAASQPAADPITRRPPAGVPASRQESLF